MLSKNVWLYGSNAELPGRTRLCAGPLTLVLENGQLRWLCAGEQEVIRGIYVAVRDRNWGTVPPVVANMDVQARADSFRVSYDVENLQGSIDFRWKGTIVGDSDGTIVFTMDGAARATFLKNRIGFCVLHPDTCAGKRCTLRHADGSVEDSVFPMSISPHQPFRGLVGISHEVEAGLRAELAFEGDVFETEDQRNWTDASYKTYCTPLERPFPAEVAAGTRIVQSVTLRFGPVPRRSPRPIRHAAYHIETLSAGIPLPPIGLGVASHGGDMTPREIDLIRGLHPSHLRVDLDLTESDYPDALARAAREADAMGARLEVALHCSAGIEKELAALRPLAHGIRCGVASWLVFNKGESATPAQVLAQTRATLAPCDHAAVFAAGSNANFTELNRGGAPPGADAAVYAVNPQVHAFDNDSLVETLAGQAATVENARRLAGGRAVIVSPVTLRPRFNAVATGAAVSSAPDALPESVDLRQMSLFGAAWTLGSIAALTQSGAGSLTFYETTGWRGVMETAAGPPVRRFPDLRGCVFPLYHVLADIGEMKGGLVFPLGAQGLRTISGITIHAHGRQRTVIANMSGMVRVVRMSEPSEAGRIRFLDETTVENACRSPTAFRESGGRVGREIRLSPYATACIDGEV